MSKLDVELMILKSEIEKETIKLIKKGVPPYKAMVRAGGIVFIRRKGE